MEDEKIKEARGFEDEEVKGMEDEVIKRGFEDEETKRPGG